MYATLFCSSASHSGLALWVAITAYPQTIPSQAGFSSSVCDKANLSLSCIQGAYDKSTTQTAKCKSNL